MGNEEDKLAHKLQTLVWLS